MGGDNDGHVFGLGELVKMLPNTVEVEMMMKKNWGEGGGVEERWRLWNKSESIHMKTDKKRK